MSAQKVLVQLNRVSRDFTKYIPSPSGRGQGEGGSCSRLVKTLLAGAFVLFGAAATAAPTATLTAPANNSLYHAPANITVRANAAAPAPDVVARVEFYANGNLIGTDTTAAYSFVWNGVVAGTYTLIARAIDNNSIATDSAPFTVTVLNTNTPPTATLSAPANNAKFLVPATIIVSATATAPEANGSVSKVDFYANGNLIGTDTTSPYSINWAGATAGNYALTAIATDQLGATTTSVARTITVVDTDTPPTVSLTAPANAAVYVNPASITVSANAASQETNVTIAKVEFYANGNLIGTDTTSPYSIAWASPAAGTYALTAKVTDSVGTEATSAVRTITVNATNTPPTVTLTSPPANAHYVLPFNVTLTATATAPETNDTVAKVEFFANGALVGTVTSAPYTFSWVNPSAGTYVLTAVATDALGGTTTSASRSITVAGTHTPPTVNLTAPANAAVYVNPASITVSASAVTGDTNVTLTKVEFYANGNLIGTDTTAAFSIAWASPAPGTYALTAKVTDSLGTETTSAPRTITVNATNTPPTVTLTSPPANAHYVLPFNVTLTATATAPEANDTVAKVEFFANGALIGTVTTAPYTFSWVNPAAGTYSLTAVATDALGGTTTSAPRSITVAGTHTPPTVTLSAPANAAVYVNPASITVSANAVTGDTNVTLTKVDFYANGNLIGTDTTVPFSIAWASPAPGAYTLTAVVADSLNATATSAARTITVNATNTPPTVTLTAPANNAKYVTPATFTISATAAAPEANDAVTKVDFFANGVLVGTVTTAPYNFSWTTSVAGTYTLTAVATDGQGGTTTSAVRTVVISSTNTPPVVSLTAPANNARYLNPVNITVSATASPPETNETVTQVEFFANGVSIGIDATSPYSIVWASPVAGTYSVTAIATDNLGATTTTAPRTVIVSDTNLPPTAALTAPANNAIFLAPATVALSATATAPETNDTVAKVEFFANGNLVGTVTTSPYNFSWTNVAAGTYVLTAKSTDGQGASTTSIARTIVVNALPTVSLTATPATGVAPANVLLTANPADSDGTITKVDFFQGATLIATVNAPGPYTYTVNNLGAGTYSFTARATDNSNLSTTSAPASVTLTVNQPPTVNITAPANNATFVAPATINITANPNDTDGTIAKVELYSNATLIATLTGPYTFSLTNVPVGSYALTAIATDNLGATTASSAVNVMVNANQPPAVSLTSPNNNALFTAPATITLTATASDSDGTIAMVEFLSGNNVIATLTTAPFTFDWSNVGVGGYTLTARVTDDKGAQTASAPVTVTVNAASVTIFYIYTDQVNSPRAITNEAATKVWNWDNVDPFGANAPNEDPDGDANKFVFNLRFPGQYFDKETGTHYNYFRDYDPATGRYDESDPKGLRAALNTFTYVGSNPLRWTDMYGLDGNGFSTQYGNWCGRNWSGGKTGPKIPSNPAGPVDSVDECCMTHDYCYAAVEECKTCSQQDDSPQKLSCDRNLLSCLGSLKGKAPDAWPKPPPYGRGPEAFFYCQKAKRYFEFKLGQ